MQQGSTNVTLTVPAHNGRHSLAYNPEYYFDFPLWVACTLKDMTSIRYNQSVKIIGQQQLLCVLGFLYPVAPILMLH